MTKGGVIDVVFAEGYGPDGAALLVTGQGTDAAPGQALHRAIREVIRRHGGRPGADNSVAYLFHAVGVLRYPATASLPARALDAGAEDCRRLDDGDIEVLTDPADLATVRAVLARRGHQPRAAGVTRRCARRVALDTAQRARLAALITELRALEGVGQVYTNAEIPEQFLAQL
jgi:transcriptional/translational regulatory protein YebC/TACO1